MFYFSLRYFCYFRRKFFVTNCNKCGVSGAYFAKTVEKPRPMLYYISTNCVKENLSDGKLAF